jgi:cytochrome b561
MLLAMTLQVAILHVMFFFVQRTNMSRLMPAMHAQPGKLILPEMTPRLATRHARRSSAIAISM